MRIFIRTVFNNNCRNKILHSIKMANTSNTSAVDLSDMRKPYAAEEQSLLEERLPTLNPFKLFHIWFEEIKTCGKVYEPNAVCLATSDKNGRPSARMVLLKGFGIEEGFKIFTNYESRKGKDLTENPNAALLFYWDVFNKQVRIEGKVEKVSEEESKNYFARRPRASQLSARISQQSQAVESRDKLVERYKEEELKFPNEVPKPDFWGGFRIIPNEFEFWVGKTDRLHDRIRFFKLGPNETADEKIVKTGEQGWVYERLQP